VAWLEAEGDEEMRKAGVRGKSAEVSHQWRRELGRHLQRVKNPRGHIDRWTAIFFGWVRLPRCGDCRREVHPYMVRNSVWLSVGMTFRTGSHLCIPCLEARLGRPLARRDLRSTPINVWMRWRNGKLVLLKPRDALSIVRDALEAIEQEPQ
jgi:hypothetical protein